jgi:hypothetical protein
MSKHPSSTAVENPGPLEQSASTRSFCGFLVFVGVLTFWVTWKSDPTRAWAGFIQNHFYFMSLAIGGLFFAALQWITGAMWSAPVRRLAESFTAYLPFVLVTFGILTFGIPHLYSWSHADHVAGDLILEGKASYLNVTFFTIRNILAILLWIFFARKMVGNSLAQDQSKDFGLTLKNRFLSPAFIALYAITFTMASFDQLMSLDPHWFSTMFGVYCFAGMIYSTFAALCFLTLTLVENGKLARIVNTNHLHDIGQFLFGFTVFWAYIGFSQFMLIWYANLPEETGYYIVRMGGNWIWVSAFLLFGKFVIPFFTLLPRHAKRSAATLKRVSIFMLVAQWIDVLWMVQPQFFTDGPRLGLSEIGIALGFLGCFGFWITRFLSQHSVVAIGDPRLAEAVHHHHI